MKIKQRLITVADMLSVFLRFCPVILACTILFAAVGYVYSSRTAPISYTATSGVYVHTNDVDMETGSTSTQITLARARALELKDAIKAELVYDNIKRFFAECRVEQPNEGWEDLSAYSNDTLRAMFVCNVQSSSQYAEIVVTAPTASLAVHLANAAAAVLEMSVSGTVISTCRIEPMQAARLATVNDGFSYGTTVTVAVVGLFLSYLAFFVLHFFNPRVRDERELVESYGEAMPLLGRLPSEKKQGGLWR